MLGCYPIDTLLVVNKKLKKKDGGWKFDVRNCRSLLGNLFYLTHSMSDMFATSLLP